MIASGLLWYDDDAHRPLALKLAEAAQRYRERVGYEPTTCQLNPAQAPAAAPTDIATDAAPKRVSARRASRKAAANLPPITLALIPDAGLRPNYFFVGVAEGEPLKRASIFRDDDTDDLQPKIPATRPRSKGAPANTSNGTRRAVLPRTGEALGGEVDPPGNASANSANSGNQSTVAAQPTTSNNLAAPQSAQADFVAQRSRAPRRGFNRPLPGNTSGNDSNNVSGNIAGKNSGNSSGNDSGKNGKRAKVPTLKPEMPAIAATPQSTQLVTPAPTDSPAPRKTRLPATKTATTSPTSNPAIEVKTQTKKTAQPAATSSRSTPAAPAPATQAATIKTKKAAKAAKPELPLGTDAPRSIKVKAPAKTAISPAATPAPKPAPKPAKAPTTSGRPTAAAPAPATKRVLPTKPATTKTPTPRSDHTSTNPLPAETKKAAKTAKPVPAASTSGNKTQELAPATQPASPARLSAAKSAKSAKTRPQPAPAQTDLWGEPATIEPRRKTRRSA